MIEPVVHGNSVTSRWRSNDCRLNEIAAMTWLGRKRHAAEAKRLEAAQDAIEYELGADGQPGPRPWSGRR